MHKIAVILYGPPGSGKGTQANLLAGKLHLIHFDTGKFFESVLYDPRRQREALIRRERRFFETGKLLTPSFVLREATKRARAIAKAGWGIAFSGSPRTVFEAKGLVPVLAKLYGRKNIFFFVLKVPPAASLRRNSSRLICRVCGAPLLTAFYPSKNPKYCPICGGPFYRRLLDNPETIRVRLKEYESRTEPIFAMVRKWGYRVNEVDGRPAPYKGFRKIYGKLKNVR